MISHKHEGGAIHSRVDWRGEKKYRISEQFCVKCGVLLKRVEVEVKDPK